MKCSASSYLGVKFYAVTLIIGRPCGHRTASVL